MRNEMDRLFEDLEYIRSNAGTVGPDHPKVKKWIAEVKGYLTHEGNTKGLKQFEQLEFVKGGSEMWSQYDINQGNTRKYKEDLDRVEAILEKMGGRSRPSGESSADQKMRELFLTPTEENTQEESEGEGVKEVMEEPFKSESTTDQKIEPNFEAITKQHLSASSREQAVDQLMAELNAEMKSSDPDWEKIQQVMSDLMGLKKTGELLDRLKAEVNKPEVKWETVREIMVQIWSIKKEIIINLMPTLLKS